MQQKQFNKRSALRFTHFSRKGYALFSVLGREVLVGVLAVSTLTYAKAEGISTSTERSAESTEHEEVKLDEVIVTGSRAPLTLSQSAQIVTVVTRDDIARAAAESINDVLKLVPGVDVRQRGGFGVQTDISTRGGNFDQITILLNGINISSPHTGHLSADFPVSPDDIERIELIEGGYENGLCGTINIITGSKQPGIKGKMRLFGGSYGYAGGNAALSISHSDWLWNNISGGYRRSDGATHNSAFSSSQVFYQGSATLGKTSLSAQAGYSYKPFEANTFYGAASTDQWESNERLMGALKASQSFGNSEIDANIYYNRWYDHYQWHKGKPAGENFHKVDAYGVALSAWMNSALGKTSIGGEWRKEEIWSTKLGKPMTEPKNTGGHDASKDIMYRFNDNRDVWKVFAEHHVLLKKWTISPAVTFMKIGKEKGLLPALNIAFRPTETWKLFASWNMALRMPTFTDLYYSGVNIEGNSELKPERTSDLQVGARKTGRGYIFERSLFYSHKTDMIDWVTFSNDGIFHSVNFRQNNWGAETGITLLPQEWAEKSPIRKISIKYAYINVDSKYDVEVIKSKYAMDYLRNKVVVSADGRIWHNLNLHAAWRWQDRIGANNPSYAILDARLSWDAPHYSIYVDGTNILDKEYYDYVSVRQPGIVVIGGIRINI